MSSDESTSTQLSARSSVAGNGEKLKSHKPDQWEINLIGNFLLTLYHRLEIAPQNDWLCKKSDMRKEFEKFVTPELIKRLKEANGAHNIGTLLHRCGFLFNTTRGSQFYKLRSKAIFDFRNRKLNEQDKRKINDDADSTTTAGPEDILKNLVEPENLPLLQEANFEIDEDSPKHELHYEGTTIQQRRQNYYPTNMSCYICQQDFDTMEGYEEHIQIHNDENDFEYIKELKRLDSPIFSISYKLCKNSHNFGFTIETKTDDLVIEKIIIVQSRSMFYVHNMRVPYPMPSNGREMFFVDSHLFTIYVEQPIILICHLQDNRDTRFIEEHHFMRALEFPKVTFAIRPFQLPSKKTFKPKFKLPDYFPPLEIRDALQDDFIDEKLMKLSNEFRDYVRIGKILQPQTIGQTLTTLLHIEDMDTIKEYLNLFQQNVKLRSFGDDYSMKLRTKQRVHIENILSVFDEVIVTTRNDLKPNSDSLTKLILQNRDDMNMSQSYLGQIEDINSGRVTFKCFKKLDLKRTYTVVFRPARLQLRHQYRALEILPVVMPLLSKFLFPGNLLTKVPSSISLELHNKSIANNPEQLQAVRNIAEGPRNDATYIIFGPPGTGKTTTLVEAILQVIKRDGTKILVTASSNSACDEIALRLCKTLSCLDIPRDIVRIYAQSNEARLDNIDDFLLEHSNMYSVHFYPDIEVLHEYRIVVCTMAVVAKLALGKFGRTESGGTMYTHLFIDEVAASTEVEALMPITSILTPKSSLIIAGDNKQLGPIVKSKRAEEFKLGVSLMDRLLLRECYRVNTDTGDYDRSVQTRLRMNFRSHPAIVKLYSGMYYNHNLEAKVNIENVSLVKNWHLAPNKEFPIIFHSINGNSYSDNQSYSLYNSDEVHIVMDYIKDLMYFGISGKPVKQTDIGVISPYKKQYLRIREELNLRKWYHIETGSVETFQGKEKDIIIVSFVRSNTSTLGFLESPRRLNVTLSRAKSLLILIGNAKTLSINPDYEYIIKECQRHQTLIGGMDHGPASETDQSEANRKNNAKIKHSNNKKKNEATIDMVNKTLQDLKLQNKNANTNRANRNKRRQRVGGKNNKAEENKENKHFDNKDCSDDDDDDDDDNDSDKDDDDDDDDNDDKPSTSKAAGKPHLSQSMKKKTTSTHSRDFGNAVKPTKTGKDAGKAKENLDDFFNGLPSVPKTTPTMPNVPTNQSQTYTQVPSLMSIPIIPPRTMEIPNRNAGPTNQNPFYFTQSHTQQQQQQQQAMYRPVQPNPTNFMGPLRMPQSNNQQQQWQQERNMQMIQMQQQQQRHPNPQFSQQLHPQCYSNPTPLLQYQSPYPTNPIHSTSPINSINQEANSNNESKRAARRRQYNRKKNVDEKSKDGVKCDDDANAASTSKVSGKTNLGHAMKKKNQNKNIAKVSKTLKSTNQSNAQDVLLNEATPLNSKTLSSSSSESKTKLLPKSSMIEKQHPKPAAAAEPMSKDSNKIDFNLLFKNSKEKSTVSVSTINSAATTSSPLTRGTTNSTTSATNSMQTSSPTNPFSIDFNKAADERSKPVAAVKALPTTSGGHNDDTCNKKSMTSTNSFSRPTTTTSLSNVNLIDLSETASAAAYHRPAASYSATAPPYQSSPINRSTTTAANIPPVSTSSSSSTFQHRSEPFNRAPATVTLNLILNERSSNRSETPPTPTSSSSSSNSTSQYTSDSLNRATAVTTIYPSINQIPIQEGRIPYNQPKRPIRKFDIPQNEKKKDNCIIA